MFLMCHNPYFNRWFSAMCEKKIEDAVFNSHNPYFNRWFSAIEYKKGNKKIVQKSHNPYFNRWFSAIKN